MKYKVEEYLDAKLSRNILKAAHVGIDIGSRAAKGVLLYDGYIYTVVMPSSVSSVETSKKIFDKLIEESGVSRSNILGIVGTGYGRIAMDFGTIPFQGITEITCHAMGAHYMNSETRTIIDIGGQDSKAIKVDKFTGNVVNFIMNDKCAAGTGRFLEKVALLLELSLDELGEYAVASKNPIDISSQCVVFAESEVISLKAKGASKEDIAGGIHAASARRIKGLLRRVGFENDILFTGGVSHNIGMVTALEKEIGLPITKTKFDPTFAGALGGAILAFEDKTFKHLM